MTLWAGTRRLEPVSLLSLCSVLQMTHDTDDQDPKENELVIALTPVQLGFVVAIAVAAVIWFVVRRKRSA